jgi:hypothetical protein
MASVADGLVSLGGVELRRGARRLGRGALAAGEDGGGK